MFLPIQLHKISTNKIILTILAVLTTIIVILTPLISHSITVQQIPNPRQVNGGWVSDHANILSAETEAQLNKLLWQLKTNTGAEFAVVTVPKSNSWGSPKEFATELFNYWNIGTKGKDNGLLWFHSVGDSNIEGDSRLEIETGYGLEGILPDSRIGNIIRNEIIPKFKANDFNGGTLTGVKSLSQIINRELEASLPGENIPALETNTGWKIQDILSMIALALGGIAYSVSYHLTKKPIYVSTWGGSQYQVFNSPSLNLRGTDTENNFPIYFYLWFGTFLITLTFMGLFHLIMIGDFFTLFFCSGIAIILGFIGIKPLAFLLDNNHHSHSLHPIHCENCRQPMTKLEDQELKNSLTKHQKTAIKLGSVAFEAWQCENCLKNIPEIDHQDDQDTDSPSELTKKQKSLKRQFHLRRYVLNSRWGMCPVGKELTVKNSSHISVHPTRYSTGLETITKVCQCCDYQDTESHILPVLPTPSSYSSSDSGGYSGGDFGGSSSGDFGGGSSGGGGAGDSY